MTLAELPSGKVELVQIGPILALQFNASCMDSLSLCGAQCCRMRQTFSVPLTEEEVKIHPHVEHPKEKGVFVLAGDKDGDCVYLDKQKRLCTIHDRKPEGCKIYHCSPGGKGEGITERGAGWVLLPAK